MRIVGKLPHWLVMILLLLPSLLASEDQSPITNRWGDVETVPIPTRHVEVFRGYPGAAYSHHPQITFHKGKLFATWSNGLVGEDNPGQKMLLSVSEDGGDTWSDARLIASPNPGRYAYEVVTGMGIRVFQDKLIANYGVYEYTGQTPLSGNPPERPKFGKMMIPDDETWHAHTRMAAIVSKDDGASWSAPRVIVRGTMANLGPQPIASGRLIMPGNISYPYTDDPSGLSGWIRSGLPRLPDGYVDDPEGFHKACRYRGDETHYCEGDFFQTNDGVIHMMLRTWEYRLAVTESADNGKTWSDPVWTGYTDARCRFDFGRLPDGRFYGLSCPKPKSGRTPMVLALSDNGVVFDRHYVLGDEPPGKPRLTGGQKGGTYGYPYLLIVGNTGYAIYSKNKEDVWVCRFSLSDLK